MSASQKTAHYTTIYVNPRAYENLRDSWTQHTEIEEGTIGGKPWFKVDGLLVMQEEEDA